MKPIKLSIKEWEQISHDLALNYPPSVMLVRSKMQEVLGFTPREHQQWVVIDHTGDRERRMLTQEVHLDFCNESQRTFFILKYNDWFGSVK